MRNIHQYPVLSAELLGQDESFAKSTCGNSVRKVDCFGGFAEAVVKIGAELSICLFVIFKMQSCRTSLLKTPNPQL